MNSHYLKKTVPAILVLMCPGPLSAGIADTPIRPFSDGSQGKHVFSAVGVVSGRGGLETTFHCASLDKNRLINIGIEIFNFNGNLANNISADNGALRGIPPGVLVTISTAGTNAFIEDDVITAGVIDQGSARIVSTSPKIMCTAMVLDPTNTPPTSMVNLPVFKKTVQKGD